MNWKRLVSNVMIVALITGAGAASANAQTAPPKPSSLTLSRNGVVSGTVVTATVTAPTAAPSDGFTYQIGVTNFTGLTYPPAVTIPAGQTSASFPIQTTDIYPNSDRYYQLWVGSANNTTQRATVTLGVLMLPTPRSLVASPNPVIAGGASTVTVTLYRPAPPEGVTYTVISSMGGWAPSTVTIPGGQSSASFVIQSPATAGGVAVDLTVGFGDFTKFGNVQRERLQVASNPVSIALNPSNVTGGTSATAIVTLGSPATSTAGNVQISLFGSAYGMENTTVPSSVTVPAGATTATFSVSTKAIQAPATVNVQVSLGAASNKASAVLGIFPVPTGEVSKVSLGSTTIQPGGIVDGSVALDTKAGPAGVRVNLGRSDTKIYTTPNAVTVKAGTNIATFKIEAAYSAMPAQVTITAHREGSGVQKSVGVAVVRNEVGALSLGATTVNPGQSTTGTVNLTMAAPTAGMIVTLTSSSKRLSVPASVWVQPGRFSATFTAAASSSTGPATVRITATTSGGTAKEATVTVADR